MHLARLILVAYSYCDSKCGAWCLLHACTRVCACASAGITHKKWSGHGLTSLTGSYGPGSSLTADNVGLREELEGVRGELEAARTELEEHRGRETQLQSAQASLQARMSTVLHCVSCLYH